MEAHVLCKMKETINVMLRMMVYYTTVLLSVAVLHPISGSNILLEGVQASWVDDLLCMWVRGGDVLTMHLEVSRNFG